jgi:2,4-dienoyl-CoA reductase-like NADH-dependent reductase (Old Yellow Enzyme family)
MASMLNLFSPLMLGRTRLPNRIVLTALPSGYAVPDGFANSAFASYYLARAQGGIGTVVIEPTYVLPPPDDRTPHLGLYADAHVSGLHHCIGALHHAGSAVLVMLDQPLPLAQLSSREIGEIGEAFIVAAWRVRAAGADGVMVSCADGGPFEQLVSPLHNHRTDRYGGSPGARLRLLLDVVEGIERWMGSKFIVGVRLNVEEFTPGGLTLQDMRVIAKRLVGAGVTLLEASAGISASFPIAQFPGWRVPLAAGIKAVVDVPVMVGGLSDDVELVDSVIREGSADLVTLSEVLQTEPGWPRYAREVLAWRDGAAPSTPFDEDGRSQLRGHP